MKRVLIIGGYGNFGRFIARMLARESNIQVIVAGRSITKAQDLANDLSARNAPEAAFVDVNKGLDETLAALRPQIVIHTSGPFQGQGYGVAESCIRAGVHYIDLADGRDFVAGIGVLHQAAEQRGVLVCTGASTVPCLSAAVIDHYASRFRALLEVHYGIATAHLASPGLATTTAVLSYAGKPFTTLIKGKMETVHGWLGLKWRRFRGLNLRPLGNCDIPDLALFPARYPSLRTIRFQSGLELKVLHLMLALLSSLVRIGLLPSLQPMAPFLMRASHLFDALGGDSSGFYMTMRGIGKDGEDKSVTFDLIARQSHGLYIPAMPAILLAKKLANGDFAEVGGRPCVDLISLDEYLTGLGEFDIAWRDDLS